ncbi:MAG: DUF3306 domain-containing protein [Litoreibacter sp.]|nr:DUF3306 domain-containing protein [Litoreibacter sp.]
MSGESNFWSRRRAAVEAEAEAETAALASRAEAEEAEKQAEKTDEEILAELDLPDPDTLGEGDDFTGFMSKAVPDRLRRRALRRLWTTNPVLANVDGLVDYGQDFTDSAMVVENLQTAYQVGKGMMRHVLEMERQAAEEAEKELAVLEEGEAPAEDDLALQDDVDEVDEAGADANADTAEAAPQAGAEPAPGDWQGATAATELTDDTSDAPVLTAPRRMYFSFETETA